MGVVFKNILVLKTNYNLYLNYDLKNSFFTVTIKVTIFIRNIFANFKLLFKFTQNSNMYIYI